MYLEEAGGALIKMGQILALRYEILPPEYCWELSELFDNVPPMGYAEVQEIISKEFGKSPHEMFTIFEDAPIASASFAQVHRAILPNGKEVAVKVQRPNLEYKVKKDFRFLRTISPFLNLMFRMKTLSVRDILFELEESTLRELDFRLEKDNAEIIRKNLPKTNRFVVPECYSEFTTAKILTQDFIHGTKLTDIMRAKNSNVTNEQFRDIDFDLDRIADDIISELGRQYFMVGTYHSDPHPGNIIITNDGKIALVDFGIVGHVTKFSRSLFWNFIRHIVLDVDAEKAAAAFIRLGSRPIEERVRFLSQDKIQVPDQFLQIISELSTSFEHPLKSVMDNWDDATGDPSTPIYDRSTAVAFIKGMKLAEQYCVHFQRDLIMFIRTLVIGDMMAMQIAPTFKMKHALVKFAREYPEVVNEMQERLSHYEIENEKLSDPWNEDARYNAKAYISEWFEDLIDNRPSLYKKIKPSVLRFRQML
jgi:predicted unusual protein kinase regulating ubiquinone biosynthesis (AarF/ABC1/UbiB family)